MSSHNDAAPSSNLGGVGCGGSQPPIPNTHYLEAEVSINATTKARLRRPATTDGTRSASMCRSQIADSLICFFVATEFALSRRKQGFESPRERQ
jgi:hypothetical protein